MDISQHSIHTSYREKVLEHLFVGEIMRYCWRNQRSRIEVLQSQVDNSGYDIVFEADAIMRHVQLKSSHAGARTAGVNINIQLAEKPSGCVIWMFFDPTTLEFTRFLWFGEAPGKRLASLKPFKVGTHTKGNAQGVKTERANIRYLPKSAFDGLDSIEDVVNALFGEQNGSNDAPLDQPVVTASALDQAL